MNGQTSANSFSFAEYQSLLDEIKRTETLCDYEEARERDSFIILRHDVEFSPKRAFDLAKLEHNNQVSSTYFFQLTNNAYNILSDINLKRLEEIAGMGHRIGLHFHVHDLKDRGAISTKVIEECKILGSALGMPVNRFSFHRPPCFVLEEPIIIDGIINAYDPAFFTYTDNPQELNTAHSVKYVADSRNQWSYTGPWERPCQEMFKVHRKVQILCHPYSWSECGADTLHNLKNVIDENREEFIQTLNKETKYVKDYLDEL